MSEIDMKLLSRIVPLFLKTRELEEPNWADERKAKDEFISTYLAEDKIHTLDEATIRELIWKLWAFGIWTNKDYIVQEMLKSGLKKIRKAFDYLLYNDDPISKRFDFVQKEVRMMGAASISEVLAHHNPKMYPVWNRISKTGLIALGLSKDSLPRSAQISGNQYENFCSLVRTVFQRIKKDYPDFKDLLDLDWFLWYVSMEQSTLPIADEIPSVLSDFDHDAAIDQILELGDGLGFDVQKEYSVTHGCRIDAIWRTRIANLGTIAYAFEVHRRGNRDSAILNLQRVNRDPSIQKVIIVSTEDKIDQFRKEIASLDERFRKATGYFKIDDLQDALDHLHGLKNILQTMDLLLSAPF